MLAFLLQISEWLHSGHVYPFAVFMAVIWLLWLTKAILARQYRPWQADWRTTTSVVIPVVDEEEELFVSVLERIVVQHPTEVIVVINGPRNETLEKVCERVGVVWTWTKTPGKRNAVDIGVSMAQGEIVVLVDSDTMWTRDTLRELVKPFRDPEVGGVSTRQRILNPERGMLTRWADWLENIRNEYSMPAMSVLGTVGCLPGRTIAFRTSILRDNMEKFRTEPFLGVFIEVSDDRTLTNYTLMDGYKTVVQSTSLVYTDAPTKLTKLVKQQFRWARGSQYNTLRMLGWMLRNAPVLALFYVADIVVPFILIGSYVSWIVALLAGNRSELYGRLPLPESGLLALFSLLVFSAMMTIMGLGIRFGRHFAYRPNDMAYLPIFMLINTFILMPVRVVGFFRLAHNASWGTRAGGFAGKRGRNAQALIPYLLGGLLLAATVVSSV
ncbi:glycosyltransferase family 2 protein [Actinocatenispora sera]|uniref:N-acetylglucosaminyltransferase n=1 Tax=Actinocatenispora sera TaxID=390989 RepID=A0A810L4H6_9ACTN|nr:glycosyltransferase family 2 protein [Actinocatenispora sera]BCJ29899.1 N-acetylglucosaminyltransferase [Actinocatenispora sera]